MRRFIGTLSICACVAGCKHERTSQPPPAAKAPVYVDVWRDTDMTAPLEEDDPRVQRLDTYFVTATSTSLCPTVEGALANDCGHSIEFGGKSGYRVTRGNTVSIVKGPHDPDASTLPVIRYMVQGLTPGYIERADISPQPDMPHRHVKLEELEPRITATIDARTATQEELRAALEAPASRGLTLVTHVKPTEMTSGWEKKRPGTQNTGFELALQGSSDPITTTFIIDMESFMFPGFMEELYYPDPPHRYICDESYCDVIDLVFTKDSDSSARLFYVIDRFGVHDLLTPDQWLPDGGH